MRIRKNERPKRDDDWMRVALSLSRRVIGRVAPNPAVGCVLVRDAQVVGMGHTALGGRPHAETEALLMAGHNAKGATAYITLEPCCHHGTTPPCTNALIQAHIKRAVIATKDPDSRVAGKGIKALEDAGIEVIYGVLEEEAKAVNAGFFSVIEKLRPWMTLKIATSLDGRVALKNGESKWITGEATRMRAHQLRMQHDAIMVGIGTVLADDPMLTCRLPGCESSSPLRIVLDGDLRIPKTSKLIQTASSYPVWIYTRETSLTRALEMPGVTLIPCPEDKDGKVSLDYVMQDLSAKRVTRVLVEGGRTVLHQCLSLGYADQLIWMQAPCIMGADAIPVTGNMSFSIMDQILRFNKTASFLSGKDTIEILERGCFLDKTPNI